MQGFFDTEENNGKSVCWRKQRGDDPERGNTGRSGVFGRVREVGLGAKELVLHRSRDAFFMPGHQKEGKEGGFGGRTPIFCDPPPLCVPRQTCLLILLPIRLLRFLLCSSGQPCPFPHLHTILPTSTVFCASAHPFSASLSFFLQEVFPDYLSCWGPDDPEPRQTPGDSASRVIGRDAALLHLLCHCPEVLCGWGAHC